MLLDLVEIDGIAETGGLEQVPQIAPEIRHLGDPVPVALEVPVVDVVEAHQRGEQVDVRERQVLADEVPARGEVLLEFVEPGEEHGEGVLVGRLVAGEPAAVHPVVHGAEVEIRHRVDLLPQRGGVEVRGTAAVQRGPLGGEVGDHGAEVIGHHGLRTDLHQGGDGDPLRIVCVPVQVAVPQPSDAEDRVHRVHVEVEGPGLPVVRRPAQSLRQWGRAGAACAVQPDESSGDDRTVCPGAGPGSDEPVAPGLDRPFPVTLGVLRHPVVDVVHVPVVAAGLDVSHCVLLVLLARWGIAPQTRPNRWCGPVVSTAPQGFRCLWWGCD